MYLNEELAEFVGAFVGDGCLSRYKRTNRKGHTEELQFTGSWNKDSQYYLEIIQPILRKHFNFEGNLLHRKDDNTVRLRTTKKEIISFLKDLEFEPGPKTKTVKIPKEILEDSSLHKSFLRGLFNTDGSIYKRYNKQYENHPKFYSKYKIIQFKLASKKLIFQLNHLLKKLGFVPNRITRINDCWVCRITLQKDVRTFGNDIITNHNYHKKRFLS